MKNIALFVAVALLCGIAVGQGNEYWHKKDYKQWNEREVKKLLEDSPWAKTHTLSQVYVTPIASNENDAQTRAREDNPRLSYRVQLRSAAPIRQAMIRQQQIAQKYDQMPEDKKKAFDQEAGKFLAASFPDTVVVHVSFTTNVQFDDRDVARHWQTQTTETLKNFTYLIGPKGEKVQLQRYTVADAGRSFQLVFPRRIEGRPLAGPQDKSIKLEFIHPRTTRQGESRALIEFRLDKMMMQGEPVF